MNKIAIVKRLDGGFALYTRDGKRILGKHDSAQDAYKQEYAIQKSKEKSAAPASDPTQAQIEAGNYKKDHLSLQGLRIAIENLKGSTRKGIDKGGSRWSVKMPADYGYVKGHEGKDGDSVDVYVGPNKDGYMVYVINQKDPSTGRFDEHKCMLGFKLKKQAIATYLKGFSDGSGLRRIMGIKSMTMPQFKAWLSVPANLKKQASAKDQLKDFIAQTFGRTARLEKTAGVEITCMRDVATAVKSLMAKQGQDDTAWAERVSGIQSPRDMQSYLRGRDVEDQANNQLAALKMRPVTTPEDFQAVQDFRAGKRPYPYIGALDTNAATPGPATQGQARPTPQATQPRSNWNPRTGFLTPQQIAGVTLEERANKFLGRLTTPEAAQADIAKIQAARTQVAAAGGDVSKHDKLLAMYTNRLGQLQSTAVASAAPVTPAAQAPAKASPVAAVPVVSQTPKPATPAPAPSPVASAPATPAPAPSPVASAPKSPFSTSFNQSGNSSRLGNRLGTVLASKSPLPASGNGFNGVAQPLPKKVV